MIQITQAGACFLHQFEVGLLEYSILHLLDLVFAENIGVKFRSTNLADDVPKTAFYPEFILDGVLWICFVYL